ncbi:MAG: translation initiation factor IF-3 [Acidimicrobiales bacterium]|nr:translation initiation factor IF-3 [Acidimicrobiaceae bacterium]MDP6323159.1 translation initiation factor IF-3 [Acidimicrobiales bacterium]MDP6893825.1 translation initiation factor IF-3 [Acidimicrobiales bacterium]
MANPTEEEPRVNEDIRVENVRLVSAEGEQVGIKTISEALRFAQEAGLDLVEVANQADPPVCRVMDYGKFKYEQSQKAKESRKKATHILVKEMKYRPKIGSGDFETKTRRVEKFLSEGSKVKVTIMFRGREIQYPQLGRKILDDIAESISHVGRVEVYPEQEGRNMTMLLTPGKATRRQREAIEALQAEALEMEEALEDVESSLEVEEEQTSDEVTEEEQDLETD